MTPTQTPTVPLSLRLTPEIKAQWQAEAHRRGLDLTATIKLAMEALIDNALPLH